MSEKLPDPKDLPGLRAGALVKLGPCAVCCQKMLEGQDITFYRVRVERAMWDPQAVRRAAGAEMMMGPLASVLGPDEKLARVFDGPREVAVHERCAHRLSLLDLCGTDEERMQESEESAA